MTSAVTATFSCAWRSAFANRQAALAQGLLMVVNDLAWIAFWFFVFDSSGAIRGWEFVDMMTLFSVLAVTTGLSLGVFNNIRNLPAHINDGQIDVWLTLPTPLLTHLSIRRVIPLHVADVVFGIGLFVSLGDITLTRLVVYVYSCSMAFVVAQSILLAFGSLAFFGAESAATDAGWNGVLLFANYPIDFMPGVLRVVLYSVVPAAFVSTVPARLIGDFDLAVAFAMAGTAAISLAAALTTFHRGLAVYMGRR